jgi:hypothetical protein
MHPLEDLDAVSPLADPGHDVHDGVDQSPCQIAAQGSNQHLADLHLIGARHAKGHGEGEHHDDAEENFGESFEGIENGLKQLLSLVGHGSDGHGRAQVRSSEGLSPCKVRVADVR